MAPLFRVKAVFDYASPHEDDLNFAIGQVITVTDEDDAEWFGGEYADESGTKHEGIFPRNFVEKFEPTAPPRPARSRPKKEPEVAQTLAEEPKQVISSPQVPAVAEAFAEDEESEEEPQIEEADEPVKSESAERQVPPPPAPAVSQSKPLASSASSAATSRAGDQPTAPPGSSSKPKPPPPVPEKPSSNSFRDRIAAFNNPAAAPIKPTSLTGGAGGAAGGSSAFIKKPFIAPPPSRNAYVAPPRDIPPPTKTYRRDEDPEIKEKEVENQVQAEKAGLASPQSQEEDGGDDQPKPTSLKERIALLQKQQMEQAQRHAEAAAKKEKPKKPLKKKEPLETVQTEQTEAEVDSADAVLSRGSTSLERIETEKFDSEATMDEKEPESAVPLPRKRTSFTQPPEPIQDGNEADMSGAGDTTEGQDDTTEKEDSEEAPRQPPRVMTGASSGAAVSRTGAERSAEVREQESDENDEEGEEDEEEAEEEEIDPEVRRKEELRARMAKMSGGMGFAGMFGGPAPGPIPPKKKKKSITADGDSTKQESEDTPLSSPRGAPPIPTMMALPGISGLPQASESSSAAYEESTPIALGRPPPVPARQEIAQDNDDSDEEPDEDVTTPGPTTTSNPPQNRQPPPIPAQRSAPPPVPSESRPPPPPTPSAEAQPPLTEGSESDDELDGGDDDQNVRSINPQAIRSPPMPPAAPTRDLPEDSLPSSPVGELPPTSPPLGSTKRTSRPPPPIPGSAPMLPPVSSRAPPPPPLEVLSRQSSDDTGIPSRPPQAGEENAEELTEYEGDYDTDIGSSVPHKDALKAHARDASMDSTFIQSPTADAPPIPPTVAPRAVPPPIPSQPPPPAESKRRSVDVPRAAPPPPPPARESEAQGEEDYDPYNYASPTPGGGGRPSQSHRTPKIDEEAYFPSQQAPPQSPPDRRTLPAVPVRGARQSLDAQKIAGGGGMRRSADIHRPSIESGFIANDVDLAVQSGWWQQSNQLPQVFQGRKDLFFESTESTSTDGGSKTIITRDISVLFQDYSQTILSVAYDPHNLSDVEIEQRHEPPPRQLRQDQMEEYHERFGRPLSEAVNAKKDTIVGDGSPHALILELLRPMRDALLPIGTRAFGSLVYANMANASTLQNDMIRPGDIISIRNAKFQGKHGAMHAKYSTEVGKPDHVAIVAEWDGTKKKLRAWEQGRENKKVKVESYKLDDLRSGEVKIWRVMPRSWVGWSAQT